MIYLSLIQRLIAWVTTVLCDTSSFEKREWYITFIRWLVFSFSNSNIKRPCLRHFLLTERLGIPYHINQLLIIQRRTTSTGYLPIVLLPPKNSFHLILSIGYFSKETKKGLNDVRKCVPAATVAKIHAFSHALLC